MIETWGESLYRVALQTLPGVSSLNVTSAEGCHCPSWCWGTARLCSREHQPFSVTLLICSKEDSPGVSSLPSRRVSCWGEVKNLPPRIPKAEASVKGKKAAFHRLYFLTLADQLLPYPEIQSFLEWPPSNLAIFELFKMRLCVVGRGKLTWQVRGFSPSTVWAQRSNSHHPDLVTSNFISWYNSLVWSCHLNSVHLLCFQRSHCVYPCCCT